MTDDNWKLLWDGLVLRALTCGRCKQVLAVAADDVECMAGMKAVHRRGGVHEVWRKGDRVAIWRIDEKTGQVSVPLDSAGLILRVSSGASHDR